MTLCRHLTKLQPLYLTTKGDLVLLNRVQKTNDGLCFSTKILAGDHAGKASQAYKHELKRLERGTIYTEQLYDCSWACTDNDYDWAEDAQDYPVGYGATESEAIKEFYQIIWEMQL